MVFCTTARPNAILFIMKLYESYFLTEKISFTTFEAVSMKTWGTLHTNSLILRDIY